MSDNTERRETRRISSILKNVGVGSSGDSPTQTFSRRSKRISFSHVNNVKEFVAYQDNQTIWGESYEKGLVSDSAAKDGSSERSVTTSACITSNQSTTNENNSVASTPKIDLFADIEDDEEGERDVEMDVSFHQSQSPTKLFNQSMFIEETVTTSVTNCKLVDMSMVGNKRKTIETISVDEAITNVTKSVKIRKMNDENLEPENRNNTILQNVKMNFSISDCNSDPLSNLNTTRIYNADLSIDDTPHNKISTNKPLVPSLSSSDTGISSIFDKTSISTTDMTIDQSMCSSISDVSKPIGNKTHIYSGGNISARIDQTFAVRNPLEENNPKEWDECTQHDDSDKDISNEYVMENVVPTFQPKFGHSRHRMLEDLTISMDIKFKDRSLSPDFHSNFLNTDEQGIEDLTISMDMDTNFKAEVGDENGSNVQSMEKSSVSALTSDLITKNSSSTIEQQKCLTLRPATPSTALSAHEKNNNKENIFGNASVLPPNEHSRLSRQNAFDATNKTSEDMTLSSVVAENVTSSHQQILSPAPVKPVNFTNDKSIKNAFFDSSALHDHQLVATTDFSFDNPLSSTRFVPGNKPTLNFSNSDTNIKANSSNLMFNYCPTLTARQSRDFRSVASSQNNTDELCNLEPDKLKRRSDMKKLFLDVSQESSHELLSETKMDLVRSFEDESNECLKEVMSTNKIPTQKCSANEPFTNKCLSMVNDLASNHTVATDNQENNQEMKKDVEFDGISAERDTKVYNEPRCQKCLNCRKSLDGNNTSFLKIEQLSPLKLDFSMYNQFKGLASIKDVIEARKKREAARELQNQLLVDQNVEAPDIRFLWENKDKNTVEPRPVYKPEPLTCYPMRMDIKYLMRNKMRTECTQWKYYDNFIFIGAVALRNEKIPSIRIHIKFDPTGPMKSDELNMPLLFNRVFIEECPTYLKRISPGNFLKHKQALALLPLNLTTILSDSDNIYKGLDEIDEHFQSAVARVNEVELLTAKHETFFKMKDSQCYIELTVFDTNRYLLQEIVIKLDRIDTVGPRNVFFQPACETTNEFKNLPIGFPFLCAFLADPKSYLLPFLQR